MVVSGPGRAVKPRYNRVMRRQPAGVAWRIVAAAAVAALASCAGSHFTNPPGDGGSTGDDGAVTPTDGGTGADRMLTPEDADAAPPDGALPDGAMPDAAPLPPCNLAAPFGTPVALTALNDATAIDSAPSFSPDGLTLYFSTTRAGGAGAYDIWSATRPTLLGAFAAPAPVANIGSSANEYSATLTPDLKTIYFVSERTDGGALGGGDIWKATRMLATGSFGAPALLGDVSTSSQESDPWLTPDGAMMFASNRAGSDMLDLWIAPFNAGAGTFGSATRLTELESLQREFGATMTGDGLTVALTSDRSGNFELYLANRMVRTAAFGAPVIATTVNSTASDTGAALSPNGCELVLSSTRGGNGDLYIARRP
jgi:Tol biopolymer transport system component